MPFQRGNTFGARRGRGRASSGFIDTPSQTQQDETDEEMTGVAPEDGGEATPAEDEAPEEAMTPGQEDENPDEDGTPTITSIPRRRPGRPRGSTNKRGRRDFDSPDPDGSDGGTPRRRRGRPPGSGAARGRGGTRGRRKTFQPEAPRVIFDKEGNQYDVKDDEALVDQDDEGDAKVDDFGNLKGGREYRVRTFTILGRGDRLYMLSTEPARCCGFRDSYLFFAKHPKLYKVLISDEEKMDLISRDILPSSYKGRNIGVVTARSVFREFGAKIIVGGRKVTDDYNVAEARLNGEVEGELADPDDRLPDDKNQYNRNRYVAWFGASDVYRTQPSGQNQPGKPGPIGRKRANLTTTNWQVVHAKEASRFNSALSALRQANVDGVYETHTNLMFYPTITQPTHAKWEQVPPPTANPHTKQVTSLTNGAHTNGTHETPADDGMEVDDVGSVQKEQKSSIFSEVPASISRNFTVVDSVFVAAPLTSAGFPGPDGHISDRTAGPNGVSTIPQHLVDELPEDCRQAFEQAKAMETSWKDAWGTERKKGFRGSLKIGLNGFPV